jgi:fatty acid desaturase
LRKNVLDAVFLLAAAMVAALEFGAFPFLVSVNGASVAALIVLAALSAPLHYGLMHETMHGNLFASERWNRAVGRFLGITLGLPFETMRFGHLAHHSNNRHTFDRPEHIAPGQTWPAVAAVYYGKLFIGNALIYTLVPLLTFLPIATIARIPVPAEPGAQQFRAAALRAFSNPSRKRAAQIDVIAIVLLAALAVTLWSTAWWVFASCILARWSVLSILDNAPHYGMPLDSGLEARNTSMPVWLRWLVLNQNFHDIHHHNPKLRWTELPNAFRQSGRAHNGSWLGAVVGQLRGPVELS